MIIWTVTNRLSQPTRPTKVSMSAIVSGESQSPSSNTVTAHCVGGRRAVAESDPGTPIPEVKDLLGSVVGKGRKSLNKALEKVTSTMDAANIPLPESPLTV